MTARNPRARVKQNFALQEQIAAEITDRNTQRELVEYQAAAEQAETHRQQIATVLEWAALTRPVGTLIDQGHMYLGRIVLEASYGESVDVEADIETCGVNDLRVLIYEGDKLAFTTRFTRIGQVWYAANKRATIAVWNATAEKYQDIKLRDFHFATPQAFTRWLFETMHPKAEPVRNWQAFSGHEMAVR